MDEEKLIEIFENTESEFSGDNIFLGLQIIAKYIDPTKKIIVGAAGHDIIYATDVEDIINAGLTIEDAVKLAKLNWMIEEDCLAHFA